MMVTNEYLDYLRDRLAFLGEIRVKKMFGGAMIYHSELPFALVADDTLYFRAGEGNRADFETAGTSLFKPYPDKPMTMPYGEVPGEVLEDNEALAGWAAKALDAARSSRKKQPVRSRTKK